MTKEKKCYRSMNVMIEHMNTKQLLEWYITAGVDVTCGEKPWEMLGVSVPVKVLSSTPIVPASEAVSRPATTKLAQATVAACRNARQLSTKADTLDALKSLVENFDGCALRLTANKTVFGYGKPTADLMLVGEAPGADEDRSGIPFVGRSGHLLDKMLNAIGMNRDECFVTNVLPWRPPGNRTPTGGEIAVCLPFLKRQIELVKPKVILMLGGSAAKALLDNEEPISRLRGKWLKYNTSEGTIIPIMASFHPAYLLRNSGQKAKAWADMIRVKQKLCEN